MKEPTKDHADGSGDPGDPPAPPSPVEAKRLQLIWSLLKFQGKLLADGLRDLVLSPISLIAVIVGLIAGGANPERYFKQLLRFGRRTDVWINLFNTYRRGQTSDAMVEGVEQRIFDEYARGGWFGKAGKSVNRALDTINSGTVNSGTIKSGTRREEKRSDVRSDD